MTNLEQARAALEQAHDDFLPIARERAHAHRAVMRNESKATMSRFLAAEDAFAQGMTVLDAVFEDYLAILDAEEDAAAAAVAEQPAF